MNEPVVSVVVPIFNVESYLNQCLLSICEQTLAEIEIIAVDDGSTDSSGQIVDEFASRDCRIVALHQSNGGYGAAVNAGLDRCRGRYVAIIESDDWIEPDMLRSLVDAADSAGADMAKGEFNKILPDGAVFRVRLDGVGSDADGVICRRRPIELMVYESSIWSAIYRRSALINSGIRMAQTSGASYQDVIWKFMTYSRLGVIKVVSAPVYNYRVLAAGSSSRSDKNIDAHFVNYGLIREDLQAGGQWGEFLESFFVHQFFDFVFHGARLTEVGRRKFDSQAFEVVREARALGVDPYKIRLGASSGYYLHKVLPRLSRIEVAGAVASRNPRNILLALLRRVALLIRRFAVVLVGAPSRLFVGFK